METGNSPCAWFCNPRVEDFGTVYESFISSSGGILGVLVFGLVSVAAGAAVLSRWRRVFARRGANYTIRTLWESGVVAFTQKVKRSFKRTVNEGEL
jgi:hypothetical protein